MDSDGWFGHSSNKKQVKTSPLHPHSHSPSVNLQQQYQYTSNLQQPQQSIHQRNEMQLRCECGLIQPQNALSQSELSSIVHEIYECICEDALISTLKSSSLSSEFIAERVREIIESAVISDRDNLIAHLKDQIQAASLQIQFLSSDNNSLLQTLHGQSQKEKVRVQLEHQVDEMLFEINHKERECMLLQEDRDRISNNVQTRMKLTSELERQVVQLQKQLETSESEKQSAEAEMLACIEETKRIQQTIEDEFKQKLSEWQREKAHTQSLHEDSLQTQELALKKLKDKYKKLKADRNKVSEKLILLESSQSSETKSSFDRVALLTLQLQECERQLKSQQIESDQRNSQAQEQLKQEISELKHEISAEKKVIEDLHIEISHSKQREVELISQVNALLATKESLSEQIAHIQSLLNSANATLRGSQETFQVKLTQVIEEKAQLEFDKSTAISAIQRQLEESRLDLENKLQATEREKNTLKADLEKSKLELEVIAGKNVWLSEEMKKFEDDYETALHAKHSAITVVDQLKEQLKSKKQAFHNYRIRLQARVRTIGMQLALFANDNQSLREAVKSIHAQWMKCFIEIKHSCAQSLTQSHSPASSFPSNAIPSGRQLAEHYPLQQQQQQQNQLFSNSDYIQSYYEKHQDKPNGSGAQTDRTKSMNRHLSSNQMWNQSNSEKENQMNTIISSGGSNGLNDKSVSFSLGTTSVKKSLSQSQQDFRFNRKHNRSNSSSTFNNINQNHQTNEHEKLQQELLESSRNKKENSWREGEFGVLQPELIMSHSHNQTNNNTRGQVLNNFSQNQVSSTQPSKGLSHSRSSSKVVLPKDPSSSSSGLMSIQAARNSLSNLRKEVMSVQRNRMSSSNMSDLAQQHDFHLQSQQSQNKTLDSTIKKNLMQFSHFEFASPSPLKPPLSRSLNSQSQRTFSHNRNFLQVEDL